jgi:serine/threonine-protein kinase
MPKVIDFGIAKLLGDQKGHETKSGALIGTPRYMSPEQCRGRNVDHRTDVYAFGAVAYEVLTGTPPFDGDPVDLLLKHTNEAPLPPSQVAGLPHPLPAEVDEVVLSLLDKDPDRRPSTLGEVVARLEAIASGATRPVPSEKRRRPLLPFVLAAGAVAAGVFFYVRSGSAPDPTPAVVAPEPEPPVPPAIAPSGKPRPVPDRVRVEIVGPPKGTEVRNAAGDLLGTAPGAVELDRSDSAIELELTRSGYKTRDVTVTPSRDQRREVVLSPLAVAKGKSRPRAPTPDDSETPDW